MATVTTDIDVITQAKIDLAAAFRAAAMHGYNEGIDNHFSLAVPGRDDRFLLNRYGPHWSELRASDILTIDLDGNVVEGEGEWETVGVHDPPRRAPVARDGPLRAAHPHAVRDGRLAHDRRLRHAHLAELDVLPRPRGQPRVRRPRRRRRRGPAHRQRGARRDQHRDHGEPRRARDRPRRGRRVAQAVLPRARRRAAGARAVDGPEPDPRARRHRHPHREAVGEGELRALDRTCSTP